MSLSEQKRDDLFALTDVTAYAKREKNYVKPSCSDVDTVEISIKSVPNENTETVRFVSEPVARREQYHTQSYSHKSADFKRNKSFSRKTDGKLIEERHIGGTFIESVSVFDWGGDLGFYEKFRTDAERYRDLKSSPCPHVPFFSYVPQYSQMKPDQFDFYLYLRDEIRAGRYPVADLSYLLLFIYELINLGECSDNITDISVLCGLWSAYRNVYPVLDKYLSEWAADYCLIHSVDLPQSAVSVLPHVASRSSLKEYYLEEALKRSKDDLSVFSECLISSCSDYVPEKSRYLSDDPSLLKITKQIFTECVEKMISRRIGIFDPGLRSKTVIKRDAYSGSLCSYSVKKRIAITLSSPLRSQIIRKEITEILRYCENTVRKNAGIRSRLTVDIPAQIKDIIDNGNSSRPAEEAYLALYDAPEGVLSIEGALDLEISSWDSTERLVGDLDEDLSQDVPDGAVSFIPDEVQSDCSVSSGPPTESVDPKDIRYKEILIKLIGNQDLTFEDLCRESGSFPDTVASDINELFIELLGDIVLENTGGKYVLVEDNIGELKELIEGREDRDATG